MKKQILVNLAVGIAAMLTAVSVFTGCEKSENGGSTSSIQIKMKKTTETVQVDSTVTLEYNVQPEGAEVKSVKWSSVNDKVATVSDKGVVKGVAEGEVYIRVMINESASDSCKVTVLKTYKVVLDPKSVEVEIGKTAALNAGVTPTEGANAVWKSKDEKIATVSGSALKGTVTGVAEGKTFIYCIINEHFSDSCEVTVVPTHGPASGTANCYIVTAAGSYSFKTVKGNSTESVGDVKSAEVLWESFGTDVAPSQGDIISSVKYDNGEISYTASDKKGNAVIAAKDGSDNILWSWHIWCTDQPSEQVYNNNAGTMMDRNLGATSATPGDVHALGLLYQWGRKDPFLGGDAIYYDSNPKPATSTGNWESAVSSDAATGTFLYAIQHPMQFITSNSLNDDWYYTGHGYTDNTRWQTLDMAKGLYDPCPAGWRVPNGAGEGVWYKALGKNIVGPWFEENKGYDFGADNGFDAAHQFGMDKVIWYPVAGYRLNSDGSLSSVGKMGRWWSCTYSGKNAINLDCYTSTTYYVDACDGNTKRAYGLCVRCVKE